MIADRPILRLQRAMRVLVLTFGYLPGLLHAQGGSGSVQGHVLCDDGDVPASGAQVELVPLESLLPQGKATPKPTQATAKTTTDFDGLYELSDVAPGVYVVWATSAGYTDDLTLARKLMDRFTLAEQKQLIATFPQVMVRSSGDSRRDVVLHRAGAISGQVIVDSGGTIPSSRVTATLVSGKLIGEPAQDGKPVEYSQSAQTDDRGMYRIAGLPPGKYRVSVRMAQTYFHVDVVGTSANVRAERNGIAQLTVFAPQALQPAKADLVSISDGDEKTGIDLTVPLGRLHSVGGIVTRDGEPVAGISIQIRPADAANKDLEEMSDGLSMPDGSYRFDLLPAGAYTVTATDFKAAQPGGRQGGRPASTKLNVSVENSSLDHADLSVPDGAGTAAHAPR